MSIVSKKVGPGTFPTDFDYHQMVGEYSVYSWCPTPDGTGPATQVHLHFHTDLGKIAVRLKSARACDELIKVLQEHREDVWGKP